MVTLLNRLRAWLEGLGLGPTQVDLATYGIAIVTLTLLSFLANLVAKQIILRAVRQVAARTRTDVDDILVEQHVFTRLSHLAPALVIWSLAPRVFADLPGLSTVVLRLSEVYFLVVGFLVISALLNASDRIYRRFTVARRIPITGFLQVLQLVFGIAGGILGLSILLNKSPWVFLSGMGAMTAVLLLVFKDTILGFVAGVQLTANDMVRPGDWIEMPKYGADGDVLSVTLNTVKVRNWDKTITTIPTYALISDSFKNWRGMSESGGRRIKRAIRIDVNSIRFLTEEEIADLERIQILRPYIEEKRRELTDYNREHAIDESVLVNGRRMTNVGTFRAYVVAYLRQHPKIHKEMTFLVRQLPPTELGLPIEVYVFSKDQAWVNYEAIQADIFDHLFASIGAFDLRAFQSPAGHDVAQLAEANTAGAA